MMIAARNLVKSVGKLAVCATLSLGFCLPTSAQTSANVTAPSTSSSKAAVKLAASGAECPMVSQAAGQSRSRGNMELLFSVKLQGRADKIEDAVVPADGREGVYIGNADGRVEGKKLSGTMRTPACSPGIVPFRAYAKARSRRRVFIFVPSIPVGLSRPWTAPVFGLTGKVMDSPVPKSTA